MDKAIAGLKELADLAKHIGGYAFEAALETLGRIAQALAWIFHENLLVTREMSELEDLLYNSSGH